ncbi:MAG: exodeoxyribonuclease VII large subunit [Erysipelotrichales bacterium]|nr:exodeoxyribonuclease VII large subunit [Erysipelotrichales bacterium]
MSETRYLSVTAVTRYLKHKFDTDPHLTKIYVKGEISNYKKTARGYIYFTLKDDKTQISCVYFDNKLDIKLKDGMKVLVGGRITIYEATGSYQIYLEEISEDGIGELYLAFQALKEKLDKKGYFALERKRAIPKIPQKIGVITSNTGAVIEDILNTVNRRYKGAEIILYSAAVQGPSAKFEVVKRIEQANQEKIVDCLIIARGGGSLEDLWAFNEEIVAEAVYNSELPIISAVGHETDFTICDFVSDLRAPTPTAAAELATPNAEELYNMIASYQKNSRFLLVGKFNATRMRILTADEILAKHSPVKILENFRQRLINLELGLKSNINNLLTFNKQKLLLAENRFRLLNPENKLENFRLRLNNSNVDLKRNYLTVFENKKEKLIFLVKNLESLNPLFILEKGFSIVEKNNVIIRTSDDIQISDTVNVKLFKGEFIAKVIDVKN